MFSVRTFPAREARAGSAEEGSVSRQDFAALADHRLTGIALITTDVFDTLLLRRPRSERGRIAEAETMFADHLATRGITVDPGQLVEARRLSQRLAFRALSIAGEGEVRLVDIVLAQLRMLGIPEEHVDARIACEVAVEKRSLSANHPLGQALRRLRGTGRRIVAVSDTTLPAAAVEELIAHLHGPGLVDRVWSSADERRTKRAGDLFVHVAREERMRHSQILHIGDDPKADIAVPLGLGIGILPIERDTVRTFLTKVDGARAELARRRRRHVQTFGTASAVAPSNARDVGKTLLGPIAAQFALRIWLYAQHASVSGRPVIAFCARGGIGIRTVFEEVIARLGLPMAVPRANLMISRLVAARGALLAGHSAALEELGREFAGSRFVDLADALGEGPYDLPAEWQQLFAPERFLDLLASDAGQPVLSDIRHQHALFLEHLDTVMVGADRLVLCDTGLYGSTQRLLAAALPSRSIETIQFARANYKGHGEEHFPRTVGLVVEQDVYSPLTVESCVLRYWHLVESLFEPKVPSVRRFHRAEDGAVVGNCGDIRHGFVDPTEGNPLLAGVMDYVEGLGPESHARLAAEADATWPRLWRMITYPDPAAVACLIAGPRSVDFGRRDMVDVVPASRAPSLPERLSIVRRQLWREGAIAQQFPRTNPALLTALEAAHSLRGLLSLRYR